MTNPAHQPPVVIAELVKRVEELERLVQELRAAIAAK